MSDTSQPLDPFGNGRHSNGRFAKGNPGGPGNPYAKRTAEFRAALMEVCTPERMKIAAEKIMAQAENGDSDTFFKLLDHLMGKPVSLEFMERIEALEAQLAGKDGRK